METLANTTELDLSRAPSTVARILRHAHEIPHATAVRFGDRIIEWKEFADLVLAAAARLRSRGISAGDRVALLLTNRPEFLIMSQAAAAIGAISVPINFRLTSGEVAYILDNVTPALLVVEETTAGLASAGVAAADCAPAVLDCDRTDLLDADACGHGLLRPEDLVVPSGTDDYAIIHTSGTTGRPKGAVISFGGITACATQVARKWGLGGGSGVVMLAPPLFHIGTFLAAHGALTGGGTALVVASSGFDAAATLETMKRTAVTAAFMVPQQWRMLCAEIERGGADGLAITHVNWGGAPAEERLLRRMARCMPGAEVKAAFGQTETTGYGVALEFADSLERIGSVGLPADDTSVRVVDAQMNDVPAGEVGEIVYRGVGVMSRYWEDEEATAEAFRGGWFHSGDLVRRDEDGFIYVVDRLKDMIISGGENIYCAEIENALAWHPDIAEVTIVGRPDATWGEVPVACIIPRDPQAPPDLASVRAYLADRLAAYKHPKDIRVLDDFPRSGIGKIRKTDLREAVRAERESPVTPRML